MDVQAAESVQKAATMEPFPFAGGTLGYYTMLILLSIPVVWFFSIFGWLGLQLWPKDDAEELKTAADGVLIVRINQSCTVCEHVLLDEKE
ncbi:hypothetical protein M514_02888 [Trichuris suis]|uniref:Uncharacterized protein n=1 Tax=Trichuris suis TaxID=68888 RepID=A0A085MFW4_9BILA|nr:hypothetical protein M513_02888 [Trichuris suis]KFD66636.1 hypothetical protein M514_02888 [Trichuris suis]